MIWWLLPDIADWLAVIVIDARLAGHHIPDWLTFTAVAGVVAGVAVLGVVVGREVTWRQVDADARADETAVIPQFVDERLARPRPRGPRSRVVAHDEVTVPLPDPDATAVLHLHQPREWSGRRG